MYTNMPLPADSETGVSSGDGSSGFLLLLGGALKSDSAIILRLTHFGPVLKLERTQSYMLKTFQPSKLKHYSDR